MHSLVALLVAAAAVCAIARSGETPPPTSLLTPQLPYRQHLLPSGYLGELIYRRLLVPHYVGFEESPRVPSLPNNDWLNKEIDRINRMGERIDNTLSTYEADMVPLFRREPYMKRIYPRPIKMHQIGVYKPQFIPNETKDNKLPPPKTLMPPATEVQATTARPVRKQKSKSGKPKTKANPKKKPFALTPLDKGYFDSDTHAKNPPMPMSPHAMHEGGDPKPAPLLQRQIRQNPNLSRTKSLVAENLDPLRMGISSHDGYTTEKPHHIHVLEKSNDLTKLTQMSAADSVYGVALIAAVGAALTMAILGFAFGWYTLSKKAKAAADVDYPAYGVTGPTIDTSGDRKLAHSAHMYHYQHQKQQIIAMERNGLEQRNGSVSDPESEEENEEGDYTVYECPGFASTGDMEVKNPLFSEEPTPATPGKCEIVKQQPKD